MIRVLKVKSKNTFKYCKKVFKSDSIYKAYISKSGYVVINEGQNICFEDRRPGLLRWDTSIKSFSNNFEIIEEDSVRNKAELRLYLS